MPRAGTYRLQSFRDEEDLYVASCIHISSLILDGSRDDSNYFERLPVTRQLDDVGLMVLSRNVISGATPFCNISLVEYMLQKSDFITKLQSNRRRSSGQLL